MNKEQLATFLEAAREKWVDPLDNVNVAKLHNLIFVLTDDFKMLEFAERGCLISSVFKIMPHGGDCFYIQVLLDRCQYGRNQEEYADHEPYLFYNEVKPKKIQSVDYDVFETVAPVERMKPRDEIEYLKHLPQYLRDYLPKPFRVLDQQEVES